MIPLPSKPKIVEKPENNRAVFEINSLYPGYGTTIGNSLRRTLLSSLGGAAVTKIKIEGVQHEFSTIEGVMEDVITIILNLKDLRFKAHSDKEQVAILKVKGEKTITGADLELPTQLELCNPEKHIATLTSKKAEIDMEVSVETGMGYSSAEERKEDKLEVGQIMIDSIFTPIKRVNFHVENMRVGKRTDFDRLFLEVETDHTVDPEDAFKKAVKILSAHYKAISLLEGEEEPEENEEEKEAKKKKEEEKEKEAKKTKADEKREKIEAMDIEELGLSRRIENRLKENDINKIKDLTSQKEEDVADFEGMGEKGMVEIRERLDKNKLSFKE